MQTFKRLENRPVTLCSQPFGDMNAEVRVDPNQVRIKRRVVQL